MTRAVTVDVLREMIFTNNKVPPTKAQLDYIKDIVLALGIPTPKIKTRRGASRFISMNREAYLDELAKQREEMLAEWTERHDWMWKGEH